MATVAAADVLKKAVFTNFSAAWFLLDRVYNQNAHLCNAIKITI